MATLEKKQCLLSGQQHEAHYWWYTPVGGGHMLTGEPDETDGNCTQFYCPGITGLHSSCCWCGLGFLGPSHTVRGCRSSPSGLHEHVAGHANRVNTSRRATGRDSQDHSEMHPEKRPVTLCVWCGSGYAEGETCDERPGNQSGTLGHQTRVMAERTVAREMTAAKRHVEWLEIRKALDDGDPGEALLLFDQALDRAWAGGRNEVQRLRDQAAKREEKRS